MSMASALAGLSEAAVWRLEEACCRFEQAWLAGLHPALPDFLGAAGERPERRGDLHLDGHVVSFR